MSSFLVIIHPDGRRESRPLPASSHRRMEALQEAVGGFYEYISPAWHGLVNVDVLINEEGLYVCEPNVPGSRVIGFDLGLYEPLRGPVVLVPRDTPSHEERARALDFFAALERGDGGEWGAVIDART